MKTMKIKTPTNDDIEWFNTNVGHGIYGDAISICDGKGWKFYTTPEPSICEALPHQWNVSVDKEENLIWWLMSR